MGLSEAEVWEIYEAQLDATHALYKAQGEHQRCKEIVEWGRWQAIAEGKITGKNEAEREANLRMLLLPQYEALAAAETDLAGARCDYEMCLLDLLRAQHLDRRAMPDSRAMPGATNDTLLIDKSPTEPNFYTVRMGNNTVGGLTWDEMLGQVAYMSCPKGSGWGPTGFFANDAPSLHGA